METETSHKARTSMEFYQATSIVVKGQNGRFSKTWEHLDAIHKGECLAIYNDDTKVISPLNGVILLPKEKGGKGEEWFYLGKKVAKPTLKLS